MELTRQILELLSKTLKQDSGYLGELVKNPFVALHNLHYAPIKSDPENGIVGLGKAFSGCSLITGLASASCQRL